MGNGRFGATPKGGMGRLALTDDDKKARDLFVQWSQEAAAKSVSMASATFSHVGRGGTRTPHLSRREALRYPTAWRPDSMRSSAFFLGSRSSER